ncbi:uncharacterized protein LAESUDRAFT_716574 [Laetiporus sulphureus 93-53]|uniref:Uncharacterized protein n=1 Tax=Laetiporus sulphureus 93-53 TaxID=1314785 RepID=A0A165CGY6_9APHY|nr:uncharacterized protein LAESUDRAFT_716574 [Laetiporus sulphureus 93-53]KZT02788.1 hypothetical protein LAESUDRAFT_716574 [Laetiporus sulphureus 93-53]
MLSPFQIPLKAARKWWRVRDGRARLTVQPNPSCSPQTFPVSPESLSDISPISQAGIQCQDRVAEVAMTISDHFASSSNSGRPIPIDAPLMLGRLSPTDVVNLQSWLQARFDWNDDRRLLFDEEISAERIASDIVKGGEGDPGGIFNDPTAWLAGPASNGPTLAETASAELEQLVAESSQIKPSIAMHDEMDSSIIAARHTPPPACDAHEAVPDIGMATYESWTGKRFSKRRLMYSLLALGHLGSQSSPSSLLPPMPEVETAVSPRAPSFVHTPIFSPWLETVRFPALEPIQSPWVPNHSSHSHDSYGSAMFPQSPREDQCCSTPPPGE